MKKTSKMLIGFCLIIAASFAIITTSSTSANAYLPLECKWKVIDCPGWGSGSYEACLSNGDGNSCNCGDVTRECPD